MYIEIYDIYVPIYDLLYTTSHVLFSTLDNSTKTCTLSLSLFVVVRVDRSQ